MGVVQQPVHAGRGQGGGHELVEAGRMDVARDRQRAGLVGGVD
jgi:hypothetical protein